MNTDFKLTIWSILILLQYAFIASAADYTLTVNSGSGDGTYTENTTALISADSPADAQHFTCWSTGDGGSFADIYSPLTTYTMPANTATVTANYSYFSAIIPSEITKIIADDRADSDGFGCSAAIDQDTAVIGAKADDYTGSAYVFLKNAGTWAQEQKLTASDAAANDFFGRSVAISGDTVVVGAYGDDNLTGSAYVFTKSGVSWTQQAKLTASDKTAGDQFGAAVSISGNTVVVGAAGNGTGGSVYVFTGSGASWTQQAKLTASDAEADDSFGRAVSVSGDTIAVGADADDDGGTSSGSVYIFQRSGTAWTQQAKLTASDAAAYDSFGSSLSLSGNTVAVGARYNDDSGLSSGSAYIFLRNGTSWSQQAKLTASDAAENDQFGKSVAISNDTLIIGATGSDNTGSVYLFLRNETTWAQQKKITGSDSAENDQFGVSAAVSGTNAVVGALFHSGGGAAYTYDLTPAFSLTVTNGTGGGAFLGGDVTTIIADPPDAGHYFVNWTTSDGGTIGDATATSTTYTMPENDAAVTANFAIYTYTLTYTAGSNGAITGTASQTVEYGSDGAEVTADPDTGYHFVNWSDGVTTATRTDLNVTKDLSVTANFAINTYNLIYLADYTGGSVSGDASQTVDYGADGTAVTADPNPGYRFTGWDDGVTTARRTDTDVTDNITVTANFEMNPSYTLTVENGAGSGSFPEGYIINIVADKRRNGEVFDKWISTSGGGIIADTASSSTSFTMPGNNATVTATYKTGYTLTVNNGTGSGGYAPGTVVAVTADPPATGMLFDQWTGDVANVADTTASSTTITMPSAAAEITAEYKVDPGTALKVTAGALLTINAAAVAGTDTEFTSRPYVYAIGTDNNTHRTLKLPLRGLSRISTIQQSDLFKAEWNRSVLLYNKRDLSAQNRAGVSTSVWLTANPIVPLEAILRIKTRTLTKSIIDSIYKGVLLVPPSITSIARWDEETPVTSFHAGSEIIIKGDFFGSKLPTVSLEYNSLNSSAKRQKRLKVLRIYKYSDARGRKKKSCMNVDAASVAYGKSEIHVLLPSSWTPGTYDLVLNNRIGLDTVPVTIIDSNTNTAPVAKNDSYSLQSGDSSFLLNVLEDDEDAESDNVAVILNDKTSANGGRLSVSRGKIRYSAPKNITAPFVDTFKYSLNDGNGGISGDAAVDITFPAMTITSVENWDGTLLGGVTNGGVIVIKGENFGIKAPAVNVNYIIDETSKTVRLKVQNSPEYADYRGHSDKSFTDINTGASEIRVEMPAKWWKGWNQGNYTIELSNKISSAAATVTTVDQSTAPVAEDDITTILSGEKYYTIDVLANDTDGESAKVQIILPERVSAYGSRIMVDRRTNTIKYFRAKNVLCNYSNDFFTYYLKEKDGTVSNSATVTVSGSLNP